MRSSSAGALADMRDTWEALLREHEGEELALAREIFAAANTLAAHRGLSRALTDPSRDDDDRAQLARDVFASAVTEEVLDLLVGMARERWSKPGDLRAALDELGLFTAIFGAERQHELVMLEEQLYRTIRVLRRTRDLRVALSDRSRSSSDRIGLAQRVFTGVTPTVRLLLGRAVEVAPGEPLVRSLSHYIDAVAERAHHLVASVTVAAPLTRAQQDRLTRILNARYGQEVSVHTQIDTSVIGGMRIRVGEDVIDGTLRTRIKGVRQTLGV